MTETHINSILDGLTPQLSLYGILPLMLLSSVWDSLFGVPSTSFTPGEESFTADAPTKAS